MIQYDRKEWEKEGELWKKMQSLLFALYLLQTTTAVLR